MRGETRSTAHSDGSHILVSLGTLETSHQISKNDRGLDIAASTRSLREGEKCMDRYPKKQNKRQRAVSDSRSC